MIEVAPNTPILHQVAIRVEAAFQAVQGWLALVQSGPAKRSSPYLLITA